MKKLLLILHTIIHLRPIQIRYQLWYRLRRVWRKATGFRYPLSCPKEGNPLNFQPWIDKPVSLNIYSEAGSNSPFRGTGGGNCTYTFLNQQETNPPLGGNIRGALWAYNLNYMDYLLQPGMDKETGLQLIDNFIEKLPANPTGLDPYPIALRGINWIKFLSSTVIARSRSEAETTKQTVTIQQIDSSLYAQYLILLDNLEYHLLANHLLEDGFSLLFGGFYFSDKTLYNQGKEIVENELEEQILNDGAHFELSPMYHQIIFDRLLDGINLLQNNERFDEQEQLLELMQKKAIKMLSWLNTITFSNGEIPLLNDSAPNIAPTTKQLNEYATSLNLEPASRNLQLSSSGYRKFTSPSYECIIDIGQIGPSYQPGHAHADTFNFVLNIEDKPLIVDTGISTYDANETRLKERGTAAHNTVTVQNKNSSEVWSSFRVARRANVEILKQDEFHLKAEHDGYRKLNTKHIREWQFDENQITITDKLHGKVKTGTAHLHFAPGVVPEKTDNGLRFENIFFTFSSEIDITLIQTKIPNGYNQFQNNYKAEIAFKNQLHTAVLMKE